MGFSLVLSLIISLACGCSPGTYPSSFRTNGRINFSGDLSFPFVGIANYSVESLQTNRGRRGLLVLRTF